MHLKRSNIKKKFILLISIILLSSLFFTACATQKSHYQSPWLNHEGRYDLESRNPEALPQYTPIEKKETGEYNRGSYNPNQISMVGDNEPEIASNEWPQIYSVEDNVTDDIRRTEEVSPQNQGRGVKVAVLLPLSGRASDLGQAMANASQLALFDIGQSNINLITRDTKGTAEGAKIAVEQAISEGAEIILGPVFSHSVKAITPIAQRYNINVIAFSTDWSVANRNIYTMGFMPFSQVTRITDYAVRNNYRKIGIMIPQSAYGHAVYGTLKNNLSSYGLTPTKSEYFTPGTASTNAVIRQFSEYDARRNQLIPDEDLEIKSRIENNFDKTNSYNAVLLPLGGNNLISTAAILTHYGVDKDQVKFLGTGLWDDEKTFSEHALIGGWYAAPDPENRAEFNEKYFQTFGQSAPRLATLSYDATALAIVLAYNGLQNNGTPAFNHQSITSSRGFSGIDGIFRFRNDGLVERGLAVLEVQRGQAKVIDPAPNKF